MNGSYNTSIEHPSEVAEVEMKTVAYMYFSRGETLKIQPWE